MLVADEEFNVRIGMNTNMSPISLVTIIVWDSKIVLESASSTESLKTSCIGSTSPITSAIKMLCVMSHSAKVQYSFTLIISIIHHSSKSLIFEFTFYI